MAGSSPLWSKDTVAVVTGGNKGVGYGIVRRLAEQGLTVVLTARDPTRGQSAVDALTADGLDTVLFHPLDVRNADSAAQLASWLKAKFGGIDILFNNAGISTDTNTYQDVIDTLETNYYGAKTVTEALLPLLRPSPNGARIVNTSSRAGLYERLESEALLENFRDEDNYTISLADLLASKYVEDYKAGRMEQEGWIVGSKQREPIYGESKMFMNVYMKALARNLAEKQSEGHRIFVVGFCPGVTDTDLLRRAKEVGFVPPTGYPIQTPYEGADTGVWLALLPKEEIEGKVEKLFGERAEYPFGWKVKF